MGLSKKLKHKVRLNNLKSAGAIALSRLRSRSEPAKLTALDTVLFYLVMKGAVKSSCRARKAIAIA